jgi:hypothetical protein
MTMSTIERRTVLMRTLLVGKRRGSISPSQRKKYLQPQRGRSILDRRVDPGEKNNVDMEHKHKWEVV